MKPHKCPACDIADAAQECDDTIVRNNLTVNEALDYLLAYCEETGADMVELAAHIVGDAVDLEEVLAVAADAIEDGTTVLGA